MRRYADSPSLWRPFVLAVGLHVLLAAMVVLGTLNWKPFKQHKPMGLTIEAVIIDTTQMATRRDEAQKAAEAAQKKQELEENRAEELEKQKKREREQEIKKQQQAEVEKQQKAEAEKQKQAAAETQRIKKQEDDARKKKEAQEKIAQLRKEQEQKQEEQRKLQQRELEKVRKQQEEAEKQRKIEAERLKQLEAREKAKADEAAVKSQVDREAKTAADGVRADLAGEYRLLIQQIVTDNWLRPPTAKPGLRCILKIVQIPGGEVISAAISGSCNGDEATRRSIVAAVERIDALPYRKYEDVFAREIDFEFKYDGE